MSIRLHQFDRYNRALVADINPSGPTETTIDVFHLYASTRQYIRPLKNREAQFVLELSIDPVSLRLPSFRVHHFLTQDQLEELHAHIETALRESDPDPTQGEDTATGSPAT